MDVEDRLFYAEDGTVVHSCATLQIYIEESGVSI